MNMVNSFYFLASRLPLISILLLNPIPIANALPARRDLVFSGLLGLGKQEQSTRSILGCSRMQIRFVRLQ